MCLLLTRCLVMLPFFLSIPAGSHSTATQFSIPSYILNSSGIFFFFGLGCLWAEPFLSLHPLFFLIFTKAASPATPAELFFLPWVSFFICRGRKGRFPLLSSSAWLMLAVKESGVPAGNIHSLCPLPKQGGHSIPLDMLCASKHRSGLVLNSSVVWSAFQHLPIYAKLVNSTYLAKWNGLLAHCQEWSLWACSTCR